MPYANLDHDAPAQPSLHKYSIHLSSFSCTVLHRNAAVLCALYVCVSQCRCVLCMCACHSVAVCFVCLRAQCCCVLCMSACTVLLCDWYVCVSQCRCVLCMSACHSVAVCFVCVRVTVLLCALYVCVSQCRCVLCMSVCVSQCCCVLCMCACHSVWAGVLLKPCNVYHFTSITFFLFVVLPHSNFKIRCPL